MQKQNWPRQLHTMLVYLSLVHAPNNLTSNQHHVCNPVYQCIFLLWKLAFISECLFSSAILPHMDKLEEDLKASEKEYEDGVI